MLCDVCKEVVDNLKEFQTWHNHHRTDKDVRNSAEQGCHWCKLLWRQIQPTSDTHHSRACDIRIKLENLDASSNFLQFSSALRELDDANLTLRIMLFPVDEQTGHLWNQEHINETTASDSSFDLVTGWLQGCDKGHRRCSHSTTSDRKMPTRLISVGANDSEEQPRLCNGESLPSDSRYLTLSHCWGLDPIFNLLTTNVGTLRGSIPMTKLPQVFQDAVSLTRRLGILYLWIDSLCILQDSKDDWAHEASMMSDVYKYGWLNIAATGFSDGKNGLFVRRDPSILQFNKIELKSDIEADGQTVLSSGTYNCVDMDIWNHGVDEAPLNRRAWVVQERLLSPRVLHFGRDQIFWECRESETCELFPRGLPKQASFNPELKRRSPLWTIDPARPETDEALSIFPSSLVAGNDLDGRLFHFWTFIVSTYTAGKLTYEGDKVVALSGLAKEIYRLGGHEDEFVAGLWKRHFLQQILWMTHPHILGRGYSQRPSKYRAPSWSWISVDGEINMAVGDRSHGRPYRYVSFAEILDVGVVPSGNNFTAPITDGHIRMTCSLFKAYYLADLSGQPLEFFESEFFVSGELVKLQLFPDIIVEKGTPTRTRASLTEPLPYPVQPGVIAPEITLKIRDPVICVPIRAKQDRNEDIFDLEGLVLQLTGRANGEYRRVGKFETESIQDSHPFRRSVDLFERGDYEGWDLREYTISIV